MVDPAIENFFKKRKEDWLKKKIKPTTMSVDEISNINDECEKVFALKNWLPNAAKRAGQISLSTHPCTFSHPSARKNKNGTTTSIIAEATSAKDGLFRTGNLGTEKDALGNAAALDVYKFLMLVMEDGNNLLYHIQKRTDLANELLMNVDDNVEDLREGFLAMANTNHETITSSKIKQVYFPISTEHKEYHLLSILTNSSHVFKVRKQLNHIRFSEETKSLREKRKNNEYSEKGYQEIYNLTTIGYGGTKPQNISVLNNQNAGKAHLLLSMPPNLSPRNIRLPTKDFFGDIIYPKMLQDTLFAFHKLLKVDYNNINIRQGIEYRIQEYVDQVILKMWQVRKAFDQQTSRSSSLPAYQKVWLFPERKQERFDDDRWLVKLINKIAKYLMTSYKNLIKKEAVLLTDEELKAFTKIVELNKEAFI
jgi:CRISPR-associated protein Csy1